MTEVMELEELKAQRAVRVFLSYAREDGAYRRLVIKLAERLRADHIDVRLDVWHTQPGQTIPEFINSEVRHADKVLIVCSPEYGRKAHAMEDREPVTGVGYESMLIASMIWDNRLRRDQIDVVLLRGSWKESAPNFLSGFYYTDLTDETHYEENYQIMWLRLVGELQGPPKPAPAAGIGLPGPLRYFLDRHLPSIHSALHRAGAVSQPPEYVTVTTHLRELKAAIEADIAKKHYVSNIAKNVPRIPSSEDLGEDPFLRPIHQVIRELVGRSEGGDGANAQIAAVNRRTHVVRNLVERLRKSKKPLILLGDPGTGKTLTLQQTAMEMIAKELRRVYPTVTLYIRLGEFHCEGDVTPANVVDYVKRSAPARIRPRVDALDQAGRLVILFDGLDEMSRERYTKHTEALSQYAASREGQTKTLFSCRINDFSPNFIHDGLVLLPFDQTQIAEYLRRYFVARSIEIDGRQWKIKNLAKHLAHGAFSFDATNPFVLWLLCFHLFRRKQWPASRTALLEFYLDEGFQRKAEPADPDLVFPPKEEAMREWAHVAYQITVRNLGSAIPVSELYGDDATDTREVNRLVAAGRRCGVLAESVEFHEHLIRFEHHRLQEYFAARHIHETNPDVDWLGKLDAPRWQETLVNLVLMGGGEEAVNVLEGVIQEAVTVQLESLNRNPRFAIAPNEELLLADRVELAARIVREGKKLPTQARLSSVLLQSVDFLTQHGNPITQMKVMRACLHLAGPELLRAIRRPLTSPVGWLRNQALVLLSASAERGGANLPTEIGYDLANGILFVRTHAYVKAIRSSHQRGAVRSLILALFLTLIIWFLWLAAGAEIYWIVLNSVGILARDGQAAWVSQERLFLIHRWGVIAAASLIILASVFAIHRRPECLWAAILGTAAAVPVAAFIVAALWWSPATVFSWAFLGAAVLCYCVAPAITMLGACCQGLGTACYLAATARLRQREDRFKAFFSSSWARCGFNWWIPQTPVLIGAASVLGLVAFVVFLTHIRWTPAAEKGFDIVLGIPVVAAIAIWLVVVVSPNVFKFVEGVARFSRDRDYRRDRLRAFLQSIGSCAVMGLGFLALLIAEALIFAFGSFLARGLAIAVIVAIVLILGVQTKRTARWVASFTQRRPLERGSYTESGWKARLKSADPVVQQEMILLTNHQSLGLNPQQFLGVLQDVQDLIKKEPALSTYWARRSDLEQVLKQERQG